MSTADPEILREARAIAPVANPTRLRRARELHGWTQTELAERSHGAISSAAISQLESGKTRPSAPSLIAIATATGHPLGFFARHQGDEDPSAFFRSLRSAPKREQRRALAWAHLLHDLAVVIEEHLRLPVLDVPRHDLHDLDDDAPAVLAGEVRRTWGLGDGPIPNVVAELERHGAVVAALPLGRHDLDAFSVWFPDRPVVILGKDKRVSARTRFDAAHELGHLVMHRDEDAGTRRAEKQAHQFASALLMPAETIASQLPATADWRALLRLKLEWGVSLQALLMRARTLGIMAEFRYVNAIKQMSARGWRITEPGDDQLGTPENPRLLELAVGRLEEEGLDFRDLAVEAGLPLQQLLELVKESADHRSQLDL
jgi:Zn-dependent peptidase ImmA (M78 family)/transcriptional regulator with XRE-family HTH domain